MTLLKKERKEGRQKGINFVDSAFSLQLFPRISSRGTLFLFLCYSCPFSGNVLITSGVIIRLSALLDCGGSDHILLSLKSIFIVSLKSCFDVVLCVACKAIK